MTVIKSVYDNQDDILNGIIQLHCPDGIECDVTYGNGSFYKNIKELGFKWDHENKLWYISKYVFTEQIFNESKQK